MCDLLYRRPTWPCLKGLIAISQNKYIASSFLFLLKLPTVHDLEISVAPLTPESCESPQIIEISSKVDLSS